MRSMIWTLMMSATALAQDGKSPQEEALKRLAAKVGITKSRRADVQRPRNWIRSKGSHARIFDTIIRSPADTPLTI